jgi:hypothetical protein
VRAAAAAVLAALVLAGAALARGGLHPAATLEQPVPCTGCWRPAPDATWQWQLTGDVPSGIEADVYDVDLFDTPAETVAALRRRGARVVCYISAGTWESWRPDASRFPQRLLGSRGWPGERWLDIRQPAQLAPVLGARLDACRAKGFDGVELDNVDGYTNETGFPLDARDQLRFDAWLANEAHRRGLTVIMKNDLGQAAALLPYFDALLVEQCFAYAECDEAAPFTAAGKAVVDVEYRRLPAGACAAAARLGMHVMRKRQSLDAWVLHPCGE